MSAEEPSSAWPDAPYFYRHFTPENLSALSALNLPPNTTSLPPTIPPTSPLKFLLPPPLPPSNDYWAFGTHWTNPDAHPTLSSAGVTQLYPTSLDSTLSSPQRIIELRRLSKSLLLAFLELVGIVSIAPDQYAEKLQDMETMLFNCHHLINQYRPHHAREQLCEMMEAQLERWVRKDEVGWEAILRAVKE
ncbi:MED7-domain-containing protein [Ascodesmis nigricans]|uniref:Mediator of RNA polymerase II transcription subunit 7 n=1 Tax=Ascodesmis nigricans TaxID=341454 RepID=A0A4S2N541_9PEZI|nr:MED7-domain-containing protein [Ascodesmis nigricans]